MKKLKDTIRVEKDGELLALCDIEVVLSWHLYPQIFVREPKYLEIPDLKERHFGIDGLAYPDLPTRLQWKWILCLFSWKRFRRREIIPYVANLEYYRLTGTWANGHVNYFES